VLLKLMNLKH